MTAPNQPRLPFLPLARAIARDKDLKPPIVDGSDNRGDHLSKAQIAAALQVTKRSAFRYFTGDGTITMTQADNFAAQCGYHPAEIWPEWFDLAYDRSA